MKKYSVLSLLMLLPLLASCNGRSIDVVEARTVFDNIAEKSKSGSYLFNKLTYELVEKQDDKNSYEKKIIFDKENYFIYSYILDYQYEKAGTGDFAKQEWYFKQDNQLLYYEKINDNPNYSSSAVTSFSKELFEIQAKHLFDYIKGRFDTALVSTGIILEAEEKDHNTNAKFNSENYQSLYCELKTNNTYIVSNIKDLLIVSYQNNFENSYHRETFDYNNVKYVKP